MGPAVETNIGFIENYRDGYGERAEFEGFVAMVDKQAGAAAAALCEKADLLLPKLPWGADFDKPFQKPTFACSGHAPSA